MATKWEYVDDHVFEWECYEFYRKLAQGFTVGTTGANLNIVLDSVKLLLSRDVDEHLGTLFVKVYTGAWPGATGVVVSSGSFSSTTITEDQGNPEWYTISMSPVILVAGNPYCIEISGSIYGSGRNVWWASSNIDSYAGGYATRLKDSDSTWYSSNTHKELSFEVWGTKSTPTKVGTVKVITSGGTKVLRLISTAEAVSYNNDQTVRIWDNGIVRCADMVATSDTDASPVRIYTGKGLKSWRTE